MSDPLSLEDVLEAFAMEHDLTNETLKRYVTLYPNFALDLSGLYHEIMTVNLEAEAQQEELEREYLSAPAQDYETKSAKHTNLFTSDRLRTAAQIMDLPRAFLMGFRDRVVSFNTIPNSFLVDFALALETSVEAVSSSIDGDPDIGGARAFKAAQQPTRPNKISFIEHVETSSMSLDKKTEFLKRHGCD